MKPASIALGGLAGGLAVALGVRIVATSVSHGRDVQSTLVNLRQIQRGVSLYLAEQGGESDFEQHQPNLETLKAHYVPPMAFHSPCWKAQVRTTTYWTNLGTNDLSVVLASDVTCSDGPFWTDKLSRKHGLGITRSGQLIDFKAYGDASNPRWWTDEGSRL